LIATGTDNAHIGWISVDGTPAQNNVVVTQHVVAVSPLANPPGSFEQGGQSLENNGVLAISASRPPWSGRAPRAADR